jgi:putative tryptophan/tyrosine transport system substrate-binding protein
VDRAQAVEKVGFAKSLVSDNIPRVVLARGRPMPFDQLKRREFVTLIGGVAAWPITARAQQPERLRRIGVLINFRLDDPEGQARVAAFRQTLQELGWIEGHNVRIDTRWAGDDAELYRRCAGELVALAPDVILAGSSPSVAALQRATSSVPIVFAFVVDPVGAGFITSLAHPGGNITGFTAFEYSISGKWLELLKKIAPNVTRVAVLRDPAVAAGIGQFAAIQSTVSSSAIELSSIDTRDASEMVRALDKFAREPNGGVIETASVSGTTHRETIISTVMRHRLPTVYPSATTSWPVVSPLTDLIPSTSSSVRPSMSIAFSKASSQANFRYKRRSNMNWSST